MFSKEKVSLIDYLKENFPPTWEKCFEEAYEEFEHISSIIEKERHNKTKIYPDINRIFDAFFYTPLTSVKVVLVGIEPEEGTYSTGMSFHSESYDYNNTSETIFEELKNTIPGFKIPKTKDLRGWAKQGVLLLNMCLTCFKNKQEIYYKIWDGFILYVTKYINEFNPNTVFILWGNKVQRIKDILGEKNKFIEGEYPTSSPNFPNLFAGKDYFNETNKILSSLGIKSIDWKFTSLESLKNKSDDFFSFFDENAKIELENEEKKKKESKNFLPDFMKEKLLRAFKENKIVEIKKSKINVSQLKNWAKEYSILIPSGKNRNEIIDLIYSVIKNSNNIKKINISEYYTISEYFHDKNSDMIENIHDNGFTIEYIENFNTDILNLYLEWIKSCYPNFNIKNNETWPKSQYFNHYIAQTEFMWKIREYAYPFFRKIWNKNIITSFEGAFFYYPNDKEFSCNNQILGDKKLNIDNESIHMTNIRAMICFEECDNFVFIKKSNQLISKYLEIKLKNPKYVPMIGEDLFKGYEIVRVNCKPGNILIWDSRTFYFHHNINKNINMGGYVSMMPSHSILVSEVKKRNDCVKNSLCTNHWCYGENFKKYSKLKYNKIQVVKEGVPSNIEYAELNELREMMIEDKVVF